MAYMLTQIGYLQILANDMSIADLATKDHDLLDGLTDDDHTQYVLVTDLEADRATIASYWEDLTDGGVTTLHTHSGGAGTGDLLADGTVPMTADWPFGNFNLFIGAAGESWLAGYTILQVGGNSSIMSKTAEGVDSEIYFINNAYHDGAAWKRVTNDEGSMVRQGYGEIRLYTVEADTADVAFSWVKVLSTEAVGGVFIGAGTTNTFATMGLTIDQGTADNESIALKSSDVAHGRTSVQETDTYAAFKKAHAIGGGLLLQACRSGAGDNSGAITFSARLAENVDTTKSTAGLGIINFYARQTSGDADANVITAGNLFCVIGRNSGSNETAFIVDTLGVTWQPGSLWINEVTNINMTLGLCINQGAADNEIMAFKSSDVDHNFTTLAETDTYLAFGKYSGNDGGGHMSGYSDGPVGIRLSGRTMTEDAVFDSTMSGCVLITGQLIDGSGAQALAAAAGVFVVRNHSANVFQVGGDGRTWQAAGATFGARCLGVNGETIPEVDIDAAAPGTTYPGLIWVDTS